MTDKELLKKFLIEAKENSRWSESCRPNSRDCSFKKYDYYYYNSLIGHDNFVGQEVIWKNEKPYWAMNCSGKTLINDIPSEFPSFLKTALSQVDIDAPFRGPNLFEENDFAYECIYTGDISSFNGQETVRYNGEIIYSLSFHGGEIS
ncbi:MAG: DUF5680 domain-containing protein [Clostridium sp.]